MVNAKVYPEMLVLKIQFTPVAVVSVLYSNNRLTEIGEIEEESFLDLLVLTAFNLIKIVLIIMFEAKHFICAAEVRCEKCVDEGYVVVNSPDFEDLLTSQTESFLSHFLTSAS